MPYEFPEGMPNPFEENASPITLFSFIAKLRFLMPFVEPPAEFKTNPIRYSYAQANMFISDMQEYLPKLASLCLSLDLSSPLKFRLSGHLWTIMNTMEVLEGKIKADPENPLLLTIGFGFEWEDHIHYIRHSYFPMLQADAAELYELYVFERNESSEKIELNNVEKEILKCIGRGTKTAEMITIDLNKPEGSLKQILGSMRRHCILHNQTGQIGNRGYYIADKFLYLLDKTS
ncbi:MAG: hypothetical protein COA73_13215 [Candidatus Hydrogenedentota bacterium]|nr:MAG: hypothetical protein COA73_13215 [Candidatus Hydrogenedentota bacterium]